MENTPKATAREIAKKGIGTPNDLKCFLTALISDTLEGRVSASQTNRICKRVGDRLKTIESATRLRKRANQP